MLPEIGRDLRELGELVVSQSSFKCSGKNSPVPSAYKPWTQHTGACMAAAMPAWKSDA